MRIHNRTLAAIFTVFFVPAFFSSLSAQEAMDSSAPSVEEFLTPDGKFDLEAARRAGFQGSLNMEGFESAFDASGQPVFRAATATNPDDVYWDNSMSSAMLGIEMDNDYASPYLTFGVYDEKLIVGGYFIQSGGTSAYNIVAYDGASWFSLGSGVSGTVSAFTVYRGNLIAGGGYTPPGGDLIQNIAVWDESKWSPLGSGMNGGVRTLVVYDGNLIAGGEFTVAGGVSAQKIAVWDGSEWSPLGSGMNGVVKALIVYDGNLIAGGEFTTAGGISAQNIASWDGSEWSSLDSGMNGGVKALVVYDGHLIAGGEFTTAGGISAQNIASWDGSEWSPLGNGSMKDISNLTLYGGNLIAGGWFSFADGVSASSIASWDGSGWSPIGSEVDFTIYALAEFNGKLLAGGPFYKASWVTAKNISVWDGSEWSLLSKKFLNGRIFCLTVYDDKLIAAGGFSHIGGVSAYCIAQWDGSEWSPLGNETSVHESYHFINVLTTYDGNLIVGGWFTNMGGVPVNNIAAWDGSSWSPLGSGVDSGYPKSYYFVSALTVYDGKLIAGGEFTTAGGISANCIAAWDGTSWSPLGDEITGGVSTLAVYNGILYAGANFDAGKMSPIIKIVAWDGLEWSSIGEIEKYDHQILFDPHVSSLTVYDGKLIAAGQFSIAGGVSAENIAAWDGSTWFPFGEGLTDAWETTDVNSLAVYDGKLIAGSDRNVKAWDGTSWSTLGSGVKHLYGTEQPSAAFVRSLTVYDGNLIVGGSFLTAGEKNAPFIAAWTKKDHIAAVSETSSLPSTLTLSQNHPNPFNPSTTIDFSIPADSRVVLTIYNITGQQVATLINEKMPVGRHSVVWNAAGMPSGMYFCTVKAGAFAETRKMLLLK